MWDVALCYFMLCSCNVTVFYALSPAVQHISLLHALPCPLALGCITLSPAGQNISLLHALPCHLSEHVGCFLFLAFFPFFSDLP
jgi:hypothetical protein